MSVTTEEAQARLVKALRDMQSLEQMWDETSDQLAAMAAGVQWAARQTRSEHQPMAVAFEAFEALVMAVREELKAHG